MIQILNNFNIENIRINAYDGNVEENINKKYFYNPNNIYPKYSNKEYAILELLAMRKGTVLTKEMFLNHLYSSMDEPEIKIIDVFVCKLRKKLAKASGGMNYIETVWGRGYMLKDYEDNHGGVHENKHLSQTV
jgi:two-component system cell cycle response regulator CtrA